MFWSSLLNSSLCICLKYLFCLLKVFFFFFRVAGHPLAQNERCLHMFLQDQNIDKNYVPGKIRNTWKNSVLFKVSSCVIQIKLFSKFSKIRHTALISCTLYIKKLKWDISLCITAVEWFRIILSNVLFILDCVASCFFLQ